MNISKSGFQSHICHFTDPYRSVGFPGEVLRGRTLTPNTQLGAAKYTKPPYMGRRRKKNKMPAQESLKFMCLVVIPPFRRSVAFRGGSGRRSAELAINTQRPPRKREIHETTVDGAAKKENQKADPGTHKNSGP